MSSEVAAMQEFQKKTPLSEFLVFGANAANFVF